MEIDELITKLKELDKKENKVINVEVKPNINRLENWDGTGIETIQYTYYITIEGKAKARKYKRTNGYIEYEEEE